MGETLLITPARDGVAGLMLNRPDARNALTPALLTDLGDALEQLSADKSVAVIVLAGAGRAFCAGVDLKSLQGGGAAAGDVGAGLNHAARRVTARLRTSPQAVIAKVHGACFTGGLEIALACDLLVAAEDAKFGDTHAKLGLRPTWGMTQRLPRAVGMARAKQIAFTARTFSGAEAAAWGLAIAAVPPTELDAHVDALAREIAANSPGSIAAYKDMFAAAERLGLDEGLTYEYAARFDIPDSPARIAAMVAQISKR